MCDHIALGFNQNFISARQLDLGFDIPTDVCFVPRNQEFPLLPPVHNPLKWRNQYSFVAVGVPHPGNNKVTYYVDGLNEKGLSVGALTLAGTQYSESGAKLSIYYVDFAGWLLGRFESVAEVESRLADIAVIGFTGNNPPGAAVAFLDLHFIVSDATGHHLVIEFTNGAMHTHRSENGVMTNAPTYDWQLANLNNYFRLTPRNSPEKFGGEEVGGTGLFGLPGDPTPASRFVRLTQMAKSVYAPKNTQEEVGLAVQILKTTSIPFGSCLTSNGHLDAQSQWITVRDLTRRIFYFASAFNPSLYRVNLDELKSSPVSRQISLQQTNWYQDVTSQFLDKKALSA